MAPKKWHSALAAVSQNASQNVPEAPTKGLAHVGSLDSRWRTVLARHCGATIAG